MPCLVLYVTSHIYYISHLVHPPYCTACSVTLVKTLQKCSHQRPFLSVQLAAPPTARETRCGACDARVTIVARVLPLWHSSRRSVTPSNLRSARHGSLRLTAAARRDVKTMLWLAVWWPGGTMGSFRRAVGPRGAVSAAATVATCRRNAMRQGPRL